MKHIFLAVALLFSAHLARSAPIGAVVQTWSYDRQTNFVTVTIINTSQKDITAFNMTIKEIYADGSVSQHEVLEELVGKILVAQELKGTAQEASFHRIYGDGVFHAGETRDQLVAVLPKGLTDFQAVIDVVTYTDGTADSKNNDAFGRIVEERKATIASKKVAVDFIKSALADTNDPDPSATAQKNITDRAMVWRASHTTMDLDPVVLESIANEIKRASGTSPDKRDALNRLANKEKSNISMLSVHAAVVENKGGPQ